MPLISSAGDSIYVITFKVNTENDRFKEPVCSDLHECLFFALIVVVFTGIAVGSYILGCY